MNKKETYGQNFPYWTKKNYQWAKHIKLAAYIYPIES